jgi:hypothetical protein
MIRQVLAAGLAAALLATVAAHAAPALAVAAEGHAMIWNGVVVDQGRVYVSGPRWTGSKALAVAPRQIRPA